jgi:hypothetical protein
VLKFQDGSVRVNAPNKASGPNSSRCKATINNIDDIDKMEPHRLRDDSRAPVPDMLSEIGLFESLQQGDYYEDDGTRVVEISNGDKYTGQLNTKGEYHGFGEYKGQNEYTYEGFWKNMKKHGEGRETFPDGKILEGFYENNCLNGYGISFGLIKLGVLVWPDGNVYKGNFQIGKRTGYGTYGCELGNYNGLFKNGKFEGVGTFEYAEKNLMPWMKAHDFEFIKDYVNSFAEIEIRFEGKFDQGFDCRSGK